MNDESQPPGEGLRLSKLRVTYGPTVAVSDIDLVVPTGSVLALVGPSGCGKSTLLRAIAGLVEPAAGTISWDGESLDHVATHQRDVGLMFQNHALFTHRTVAQNIGFGLKMAGTAGPALQARVDELLSLVGLEGFGPRPVEGLSGGEAQRVALARALAPNPRLLLLDEPLASLDRARRIELNRELARLLRELDQTAVYVTHDQDEAFAVADQLGVMHAGKLLRVGTPAEVWRDPRNELVARFLGHETVVVRDGRRYAVRADAVRLVASDETGYQGTVTRCVFQGDRFEVTAMVDQAGWRFFHDQPVPVGSSVSLSVDPSRLALLGPDLSPGP